MAKEFKSGITNSRIINRVTTLAAGTSYTPSGDTSDEVIFSSPTGNFTVNAPTGTPQNGDKKIFRMITGTTAYAATWNAAYVAGTGMVLPASFSASKTTNLIFKYDSTLVKWVLVGTDDAITAYVPMQLSAQRTVSAATTATILDGIILCSTTTAGFTVTLPSPATWAAKVISVKKITADANTLTVTTPTGVIEGGTASISTTSTTRPNYDLYSDGTNIWLK